MARFAHLASNQISIVQAESSDVVVTTIASDSHVVWLLVVQD